MVFELSNKDLISKALEREEGVLASNGALTVVTGKRTGRSPLDRYIVEEETTKNDIEWGEINRPFDEEKFYSLWSKVESYFCLLYTSPSPRDISGSRMPSSA